MGSMLKEFYEGFCSIRFWTESAELPGPLEAGSDGSEGNRVSQLLAAGSCCGCVAVAGITWFMQSFAAGVWTVIL